MRLARCLVIAALAIGLVTPVAAAEPTTQPTRAITLISGDKVVVDEQGNYVRTEGRTGMSFVRYVENDHQFVVPEDALPLLRDDRIDKRFFDITALLDYGYEDRRIDRIPLLGNGFSAKSDAGQQWGKLLRGPRAQASKIWLDGRAKLTLAESVPMVGASRAWQQGLDGAGVTVAVLDTGYDQEHPELKGVVKASKDFTGGGIQDVNGHGTHVASTVAGRGATYTGVAKGASLAIGKVCEAYCQESHIIAGMEWAAREVKATVVNMSLGGDQSDGNDPLSAAVNRLTEETGALFVVSAGNDGRFRKVSAPAAADAALAVANVTKQGALAESSSRGPRVGDFAVKPDLAAPGTDIVAARAKDTLPHQAVGEHHARLTGTSMAAPHVAGAAAILKQRNPSWTAKELKAQLMASASTLSFRPDEGGVGLLDVAQATQPVRADVGSLSYGLFEWPHTAPVEKTITYHNDGDQPVTLKVSLPLGGFSLSKDTVTVPAKGAAPVTVTLDPRKGNGMFYGHLTAQAPNVRLTTAVGAYVQEERHKLTARVIGRDGKPAKDEYLLLVNRGTGESTTLFTDATGTGEVKLPVADFAVMARIDERDANHYWFAPISVTDAAGKVSMTKDTVLTLDARQGKPMNVDVRDSRVELVHREVDLSVPRTPTKSSGVAGPTHGATEVYGLPFGDPLPDLEYDTLVKAARPRVTVSAGFPVTPYESSPPISGKHELRVTGPEGDVRGALVVLRSTKDWELLDRVGQLKDAGAAMVLQAGPVPFGTHEQTPLPVLWTADHHVVNLPATMTVTGNDTSPVSYNLFYPERVIPAGKAFPRGNVAEVKARYRSSGADHLVRQRLYPVVPGMRSKQYLLDEYLLAPAARTEYYSAGNGLGWHQEVFTGRMFGRDARDSLVGVWADQKAVTFRPGEKTSREWNAGVSGPRFGTGHGHLGQYAASSVTRSGDTINARITAFSQGSALESWVRTGWGSLTLTRDGQSLGSSVDPWSGDWQAPAGRYELALTAQREAPQIALSTKVDTKWGFTAAADGPLPLLQVAYDVQLDIRNSARAGAPVPVKFTVTRQDGRARVREWKAWASHDDGVTWKPIRSIVPPGKAGGFVSLRYTATDTDGNTIDQTVIRAFRVRP